MTWGRFFYPHKCRVRDVQGFGSMGRVYADAPGRELDCETKDEQRVVRGADSSEIVSSTNVTVPLATNVAVGAMVTVWPGGAGARESEVLAVGRNENGGSPLDSYLVLYLA